MANLNTLYNDLENLVNATNDDFEKKRWSNYPHYIEEYNRLLTTLQQNGIALDMTPVNQVQLGQLAVGGRIGAGTDAERAKLGELKFESNKLFSRVKESSKSNENENQITPIDIIMKICDKFHTIVQHLSNSRQGHSSFAIADEYDVQTLFHSLLKIFFDDVREEDPSSINSGGSSRIDLVLKREKILIELKKTRQTLTDKEIGAEILIDIGRYSSHPEYKNLFCFIYDPEGYIKNPRGLEFDLREKSNDKLKVFVSIRP